MSPFQMFRLPSLNREEGYSLINEASSSSDGVDDEVLQVREKIAPRASVREIVQNLFGVSNPSSIWARAINGLVALLVVLLPSFIVGPFQRFYNKSNRPAHNPLRPTAYLDGLRGVAAMTVYIFHYSYLWFPSLKNAWGSNEDNKSFWQLPIVRVLHSGRASVTVFFVISGYVLTTKTLTIVHKHQLDKVLDTLSGSLFRRPFRLYLPIMAATALSATLSQLGLFLPTPDKGRIPVANSAIEQFWSWWSHMVEGSNIFRTILPGRANSFGNPFDPPLWTIPVEMKGSVLVFALLLALSRTKRWIRLCTVVGVGIWLVSQDDFDQALFVAGLFFAEVSLILPPDAVNPIRVPFVARVISSRTLWILRHVVTITVFVICLHLFSWPQSHAPYNLGYITISKWTPNPYTSKQDNIQRFWLGIGSILFIPALMYSPPLRYTPPAVAAAAAPDLPVAHTQDVPPPSSKPFLQRLFTNRFAQYLGEISYSFYLLHLIVIHGVGARYSVPAFAEWDRANAEVKKLASGSPEAEALVARAVAAFFWRGWVPGLIVNTIALLWAADVFTRMVDTPAVNLTRNLWLWACAKK